MTTRKSLNKLRTKCSILPKMFFTQAGITGCSQIILLCLGDGVRGLELRMNAINQAASGDVATASLIVTFKYY
jgi:hypothetical protein